MTNSTLDAPKKLTNNELHAAPLVKLFGYCERIHVTVAFVMFDGEVVVYGKCNDHEKDYTIIRGSLANLLKRAFEAGENVGKVYRDIIL